MEEVFRFLNDLKQNNNRDWFQKNKQRYESSQKIMVSLAGKVLDELNKTDVIENINGAKCVHRIYRDVRFKSDKTPYKNNLSARFVRATALRRGGYYLHIEPNNCFVGGGFWSPNPQDLLTLRSRIDVEENEYRQVINSPEFIRYFGTVHGEKLKTAPKGFSKDASSIELIVNKQFLLYHTFTEKEIHSENFYLTISESFKAMRPYLDLMTYFLTTDGNGEYIV
ncbi:MAG: DUF2461 domain-containing protein [Leadbetterella sp.]